MDFAIVFALFCDYAPLWLVLHYATQHRRAQGLSHGEEKLLSDL
jgi:phage shock protein B